MNTAVQLNPLEQAVITVAHVAPAKGPGKSAWVKSTDGVMFGIWPDKLGNLRPGETYEIEFSSKVSNGTTYRDIKHLRIATPPGPAPAAFTAVPRAQSLSSAAATPEARQSGGNASSYYRPTSPRDAERMFVCSTLNAFIQTGRVDCDARHLVHHIGQLREAWAQTFGSDPD